MLRISCIGDYTVRYSYFTAGIMEGAHRLGHWFRPIPLLQPVKEIAMQVNYFKPDVIFTHQIFNDYHDIDEMKTCLKTFRKSGIKIILHEGDPKPEPRFKENISEFVDIGLLNHRLTKEWEEVWGISCYHWPYFCLYQSKIEGVDEKFRAKVSFSGNITKREDPNHVHFGRGEFLEELAKHIELRVYPNEEVPNSRFLTPIVTGSSDAVLGFHIGCSIKGYVDTRPFQNIGAGALYFHDKCEGVEQFFQDGVHYVGYESRNIDSFLEKYRFYVEEYPATGEQIRQTGFNYCQKEHNTRIRVEQALEWLRL